MNVEGAKPALSPAAAAAHRRRMLPAAKPILGIVQQHGEEAAFLWAQRDQAVRAPHFNLTLLDRLDERVDAHVDGLRVAGDEGWEIAKAGLAPDQPGGVFSAAALAFDGRDAKRLDGVLEAAAAAPAAFRAVASALGWIPWKRAEPIVKPWLESPSAPLRKLSMAAFALHRRDPGGPLLKAVGDAEASVRARAFKALGELGLVGRLPLAQRALGDPNPDVAFAAAWSTALLSKDAGPLIGMVTKDLRRAGRGIPLAARQGGADWARAFPPRLAINAAGHAGDPAAVPWLLDQMKAPALARVAGEAFSMITGAEFEYEDLEGAAPEGFEAGPNEDPKDENVELDPDENLPWPKMEAVQKWWEARKGGLRAGTRHLLGKPIEAASLQRILREGRQRARAAAALELAILAPGKPLFEVRAPGFRQKAVLGA